MVFHRLMTDSKPRRAAWVNRVLQARISGNRMTGDPLDSRHKGKDSGPASWSSLTNPGG